MAYAAKVQRLKTILRENEAIWSCTCKTQDDCSETQNVKCETPDPDNPAITFWHIHFDPCMCEQTGNEHLSRCDCIVFVFDIRKQKQAMFVIELKSTYNKNGLTVIKQKLQNSINIMQQIIGGHMNDIEVFPVLSDKKHSSIVAQAAQTSFYQVQCYGKSKSIILHTISKNIARLYCKE